MTGLQSFDEFTSMKAEKAKAENEAKLSKTRETEAIGFKQLLAEYGVSKVSELDEEQKSEFYSRLEGTDLNESALSISGKRDAKKALTQYNKILNDKFNLIGASKDKSTLLGVVKYLFWNAMEDANFSREANKIMQIIKGNIGTILVPIEGLGGLTASVGATSLKRALDDEYSRISNAAGYSGIGVVEGTALFLEQIGEAVMAANLLASFNAQFESTEVLNARILEGNAFGSARAKAIADGKDEFEVDGETYKVKSVDKEDKENAEEFAGESVVNEAKYDKKKLLQIIKGKDDILVTTKNGDEFILYAPDNGNDENTAYWDSNLYVVGVVPNDGDEVNIPYGDIIKVQESKVNEAEVKSDDDFKEYAFTVLKKAFGEDFDEAKAQEVVDGILDKCGDDYGACVGMLTSSL